MKRAALVAIAVFFAAFTLVAAANANLPGGTELHVRTIEKLSSADANVGDAFHGTLAQPVIVNGRTMFAKGAEVSGEIVRVERSGRLSSPGELHLVLKSIRSGFRSYPVSVSPLLVKGASHAKSNIGKIGGGTAAGAIIGGIAGGGKGALIGAGVGAAGGTAVAAATGKREAVVESEAVLTWVVAGPPPSSERSDHRYRGNDFADDDDRRGSSQHRHSHNDHDYDDHPSEFSKRERQIIRACFADGRSGLPPGLAKRDRLPPGLEKQLRRKGTLPPGLQKKVQPLSASCEARLPRLPRDWSRVVLSGRILLLDAAHRILDMFILGSEY
jgi:hypothetical protein